MSRFNLDQIAAFLAVVRLGGIHRAAESLFITQPAVTSRIKKLEEELGVTLFERSANGMNLTRSGEILREYAEKFEHLSELIENNVVNPESIERFLRVGVSETIAQCWLPDLISRIHQDYPRIKVDINVDISANLRNGLLNRRLDLVLSLGPISDYSVNNIELPPFELAWYESARDPMQKRFQWRDRSVITYARNTRPYRELKAVLFEKFGPDVSLITSSSLSTCFRLVEMGLGIAPLPRLLGLEYVKEGKVREIDPGWQPNPLIFSASYLGEPRNPGIERIAHLAHETAEQYHEKAQAKM